MVETSIGESLTSENKTSESISPNCVLNKLSFDTPKPKGDETTPEFPGGSDFGQLRILARKVHECTLARILHERLREKKVGTNQIEFITFKLSRGRNTSIKCNLENVRKFRSWLKVEQQILLKLSNIEIEEWAARKSYLNLKNQLSKKFKDIGKFSKFRRVIKLISKLYGSYWAE